MVINLLSFKKTILALTGLLFLNLIYSNPLPTGIFVFKVKGTDKIIQYHLQKGFFVVSDNPIQYSYQERFELEATDDGYYKLMCFSGRNLEDNQYLKTNNNKFQYRYQKSLDYVSFSRIDLETPEFEFRIIQIGDGFAIENKARPGEFLSYDMDNDNLMMKVKTPGRPESEFAIWTPVLLDKKEDVYVSVELSGILYPLKERFHNRDCYRMQGNAIIKLLNPRKSYTYVPVKGNKELLSFNGNKNKDFDFRLPEGEFYSNLMSSATYYVRRDDLNDNALIIETSTDIIGCHKSGHYTLDYNCGVSFESSFLYPWDRENRIDIAEEQNTVRGVHVSDLPPGSLTHQSFYRIKSPEQPQVGSGIVYGQSEFEWSPQLFISGVRFFGDNPKYKIWDVHTIKGRLNIEFPDY